MIVPLSICGSCFAIASRTTADCARPMRPEMFLSRARVLSSNLTGIGIVFIVLLFFFPRTFFMTYRSHYNYTCKKKDLISFVLC